MLRVQNLKMENLFDSLLDLTAKSTFLKASEVAFQESTNIEFRKNLSLQRSKIQQLIKKILNKFQEIEKFDYLNISDIVDALLEKADVQMDMSSGKLKKNILIQESSQTVIRHATQLSKPQLKFKDIIDNSNAPFVSKLSVKLNAKRALDYDQSSIISTEMVEHLKSIHNSIESHPYEFEISCISYPSRMFVISPEILYSVNFTL